MAVPAATADDQKPYEIPFFELGGEEDAGRWRELCDEVRRACETHGCFCLSTEKIPAELRGRMVEGLKQLFDLPEETKKRHVSPKPYGSYLGKNDVVPFMESFGVDGAHEVEEARAFSRNMWPEGNSSFSETLREMSAKMLDLNLLLTKMILTSYGLAADELHRSYAADTASSFRLIKYKLPPPPPTPHQPAGDQIGLVAHTDKNTLTIIGQNNVQGLELQTPDGDWVAVTVPDGAFVAIVGDTLKAWSNGRLHAVRHRVVVRGEEERYSWGSFLMPKSTVEVPTELVDGDHPLLYRPFNYAEFLAYFVSKLSDDALEAYAGVASPAAAVGVSPS